MPTAVINKPDAITSVISGVAGALKGKAQGEQYNEDVRRYDQDYHEKVRQYDEDLSFRIHSLDEASRQQQLNRDQENSLENLRQTQLNFRQKNDFIFQADENVKTKTFQGDQNERDRKVTLHTAAEQQKTTRSGNWMNHQIEVGRNEMQALEQKSQLQYSATQDALTRYADPVTGKIPENMKEQAFNEYRAATAAAANKKPGQIPDTPEQIAAERASFFHNTNNFDKYQKSRADDIQRASQAQSVGEMAGRMQAANIVPSNGVKLSVADIMQTTGEPDPVFGVRELKPEAFGIDQRAPTIRTLIENQRNTVLSQLVNEPNPTIQQSQLDTLRTNISQQIDQLSIRDDQKSALKDYYFASIDQYLAGGTSEQM
jgi:hypothetical protein